MCCLQASADYSLLTCRLYLAEQTNGVADMLSRTRDTQTGVGVTATTSLNYLQCSTNPRTARWHCGEKSLTEQTGLLLEMEKNILMFAMSQLWTQNHLVQSLLLFSCLCSVQRGSDAKRHHVLRSEPMTAAEGVARSRAG